MENELAVFDIKVILKAERVDAREQFLKEPQLTGEEKTVMEGHEQEMMYQQCQRQPT